MTYGAAWSFISNKPTLIFLVLTTLDVSRILICHWLPWKAPSETHCKSRIAIALCNNESWSRTDWTKPLIISFSSNTIRYTPYPKVITPSHGLGLKRNFGFEKFQIVLSYLENGWIILTVFHILSINIKTSKFGWFESKGYNEFERNQRFFLIL